MARTRELVKRRKSVRNTRKITKTMEMVATAKFKRASDRIQHASPYADRLAEMVSHLVTSLEGRFDDPLVRVPDQEKKVVLVAVSANRGLCGGYNSNVLSRSRAVRERLLAEGKSVELHVAGKKGLAYFRYLDVPVATGYTEFDDRPSYKRVREIADGFLDRFRTGDFDRTVVVYTRFESSARQRVVEETFLPLSAKGKDEHAGPAHEYLYEPEPGRILAELLPHTLRTRFFTVFLHAAASEQVSRMVAMKNATENAEEMIKSLTRMYNRARQSQITTEILEIMGAKAAMESSR